MIKLIGFEKDPFSIIIWQRNGEDSAKTVCYTKEEELEALSRFYLHGDLYNSYDKAVVHRKNGSFEVKEKQKEAV